MRDRRRPARPSCRSRPAPRRCSTQGSIHTSLVGPSSTRSAWPPARENRSSELQQDQPPVRALHLARPRRHQRAREAVGEELPERLGERCSAPTNSHQLCCSHCSKRRSSQLVSSVSSRSTNAAYSCAGIPSCPANEARSALSSSRSPRLVRRVRRREQLVAPAAPGRSAPARRRPGGRPRFRRGRGSAASCPAGGGRSPGRSGSRARPADRRGPSVPEPRHRDAARLAARRVALLVDGHLEAALRQLVRGADARDATAEDCDRGHAPTLSGHTSAR